MRVGQQVATIFAATQGYLDGIDVDRVTDFVEGFRDRMRGQHEDIIAAIQDEKDISEETEKKLRAALESFLKDFAPDKEELPVPAAAEAEG
jgi:F-type H+-transporting ATPase subunit alpha